MKQIKETMQYVDHLVVLVSPHFGVNIVMDGWNKSFTQNVWVTKIVLLFWMLLTANRKVTDNGNDWREEPTQDGNKNIR